MSKEGDLIQMGMIPDLNGSMRFEQSIYARNIIPVKGVIWFVDKSSGLAVSGNGKTWERAFLTVTEAIAAAGNYDTIVIAAGFYTEAATLVVTQVGLKIFGLNSSGKTRGPVGLKTPTAAGPIITVAINANDCEIAHLCFITTSGQKGIQLGGAAAGYVWRTHIHDCSLHGDGSGTYGIGNYGITTTPSAGGFPDVAECVVERCHFYAWATAALATYGTRMMNRGNSMFVPASGVGIVLGCGRPFSEITYNIINGTGTCTGILITGDDDGSTIVFDNAIANCTTPLTKAVSDAGLICNKGYADGVSMVQHDPT